MYFFIQQRTGKKKSKAKQRQNIRHSALDRDCADKPGREL